MHSANTQPSGIDKEYAANRPLSQDKSLSLRFLTPILFSFIKPLSHVILNDRLVIKGYATQFSHAIESLPRGARSQSALHVYVDDGQAIYITCIDPSKPIDALANST